MDVNAGRWTAQLDGDFVVFLIGADVRDPAQGDAIGLLMAMVEMLAELEQDPASGLLGYQRFGPPGGGVIVQYWRSFEALESYARNPSAEHAPVWRGWNQLAADERSGAGIWHETFQVAAGAYEAVYQNMPATGLQRAGTALTVSDARESARQRLTAGAAG